MKKIFTLFFVLMSIMSKADQLSYLTLQQATIATKFLSKEDKIISWCACCEDDPMNLITIQSSYYKKVEDSDEYYQVFIKGKDMYGTEINEPFDLAYLHFNKDEMAVCLGIGLGFKCDPCTQIFEWPFGNSKKSEKHENVIDQYGFEYVTKSKDGSIYSIIVDKNNNDNTAVWVRNTIPLETLKKSRRKLIKTGGGHSLAYIIFNCSEKVFSIEELLTYNNHGELVKADKTITPNIKIVPGSIMFAIYSRVCLE